MVCFEIKDLFELRVINKRIGEELIPMCFKYLKYTCPEDGDEDTESANSIYKIIKNASKVDIFNISGSPSHLNRLKEIADNVGKNARFLYLNFDGKTEYPDVVEQYVEVFRKFDSIDTLRVEFYDDGNATAILAKMMEDNNFPWFEKVTTIKCYLVREIKDKTVLQTFFTKFRNLNMFKGIIDETFNPLELF